MTDSVMITSPPHDPITPTLSAADDRITLSNWLPPQQGIAPVIRIGKRWISILWALPIGAAALVVLIAVAQAARELPGVQAFITEYLASPRPHPRWIRAFRGGCSYSTS
jgi:methionine sulfoxide reductase catalytic subunit